MEVGKLEGDALIAAVAEAERLAGRTTSLLPRPTDWEQQIDLIIDRERIATLYDSSHAHWAGGFEMVYINDTEVGLCYALDGQQFGPTRRIAAMRAYVYRARVKRVDSSGG